MKHVLMAAIAATRLLTGSAAKAVTLKVEYDLDLLGLHLFETQILRPLISPLGVTRTFRYGILRATT
jgi:hypothetical protein